MRIANLLKNVQGQSLVEFALVVPVLMLIVFGVVDLSRFVYHQSLLSQTARESVRLASVGESLAVVTERIENLIAPLTGSVTSEVTLGTDDQGNPCTIIVFSPVLQGNPLETHISPPYAAGLAVGDTIRVAINYSMDYVTPLTSVFGSAAMLRSVYYTRIEKPPPSS